MILVTGGAGYIGSHTCVELLQARQEGGVFDIFCNCCSESLKRVEAITGKKVHIVEGDIRDQAAVETGLSQFDFRSVIHFVGMKVLACVNEALCFAVNIGTGTGAIACSMSSSPSRRQ